MAKKLRTILSRRPVDASPSRPHRRGALVGLAPNDIDAAVVVILRNVGRKKMRSNSLSSRGWPSGVLQAGAGKMARV